MQHVDLEERGVDDDEPAHEVGARGGERQPDHATPVVAHDVDRAVHLVQDERGHLPGQRGDVVGAARLAAAQALEVGGEHDAVAGELGEHPGPGRGRLGHSVQQQHRAPDRGAGGLGAVDREPDALDGDLRATGSRQQIGHV